MVVSDSHTDSGAVAVLSSILAHRLPKGAPVMSIYLDYKCSNLQTLPHLVGSLLQQLIQIDETIRIPEELKFIYKKASRLRLEPVSYFEDVSTFLSRFGKLDHVSKSQKVIQAAVHRFLLVLFHVTLYQKGHAFTTLEYQEWCPEQKIVVPSVSRWGCAHLLFR